MRIDKKTREAAIFFCKLTDDKFSRSNGAEINYENLKKGLITEKEAIEITLTDKNLYPKKDQEDNDKPFILNSLKEMYKSVECVKVINSDKNINYFNEIKEKPIDLIETKFNKKNK